MKISNAVESRVTKAWMREIASKRPDDPIFERLEFIRRSTYEVAYHEAGPEIRRNCHDDSMVEFVEFIRRSTYEVAYHEAGHVVANLFTGHEAENIESASIIPNSGSLGRVKGRHDSEHYLERYPAFMRQPAGRCLLVGLLAGRVAEDRVRPEDEREEIVDFDGEEWEMKGSDLFRAARISSIMTRRHMPQNRILGLAEKWTKEIFAIPQVWNACKRLAEALLESGTVRPTKIDKLCGDVRDMAMSLPVWRRRLFRSQKNRVMMVRTAWIFES